MSRATLARLEVVIVRHPKEPSMSTRTTALRGTPCWFDLGTSDKARSSAFYGDLFGWSAEDAGPELGSYTTFSVNGGKIAGGMQNDGQMGPDGWMTYLASDDIEQLAETAVAHGGTVFAPPMAVADLGHMMVLADPSGAVIGAWQPGQHTGFQRYGEQGAPGWFELWTRDWEGSITFYREVFGSEITIVGDSPELRYAVITEGETQWAGIMDASGFLPEGGPAHWSVYFHVEDEDATIAKAQELGGAVVQAAEDTPYGRLATLTDATGATFKLVQPPVG
jgi:predicted enzyme related to lactoylglutathione lyase